MSSDASAAKSAATADPKKPSADKSAAPPKEESKQPQQSPPKAKTYEELLAELQREFEEENKLEAEVVASIATLKTENS